MKIGQIQDSSITIYIQGLQGPAMPDHEKMIFFSNFSLDKKEFFINLFTSSELLTNPDPGKVTAVVCDIFHLSPNQRARFMCQRNQTNYSRKKC